MAAGQPGADGPLGELTCPGRRHGSINAVVNFGCRCAEAVAARNAYAKQMRVNKLAGMSYTQDNCGVRRRLRALVRDGWTFADLARMLDTTRGNVSHLAHHHGRCRKSTHDRVKGLYDSLDGKPGASLAAAARAERAGWPRRVWWFSDSYLDDPDHPEVEDRPDLLADRRAARRERLEVMRGEVTEQIRVGTSRAELIRRGYPERLVASVSKTVREGRLTA